MVKSNDRMVTDVVHTFWAAMARGEFITGAAADPDVCEGRQVLPSLQRVAQEGRSPRCAGGSVQTRQVRDVDHVATADRLAGCEMFVEVDPGAENSRCHTRS